MANRRCACVHGRDGGSYRAAATVRMTRDKRAAADGCMRFTGGRSKVLCLLTHEDTYLSRRGQGESMMPRHARGRVPLYLTNDGYVIVGVERME
jgi:hypothetical protein